MLLVYYWRKELTMKNTELAAWINNAAIEYECDLDDKVDASVAADNFINNVLHLFVDSGYRIKIESISYETADPTGTGVVANNNHVDIFDYTE
jgi:hypothetical protein